MDDVSKGGLSLAQHIAPVYFDNPKVRVVMVGGSVSRGCADQYSDLDIGVFWAEPPSDEGRKLVVQRGSMLPGKRGDGSLTTWTA